jgi:hypothetical protein
MTTKVDTLVDRYLTDLEAELRGLPGNRRQELLDEVGEHIAAARAALDAETEAAIRTVLERLGDPADIAAEARERFGMSAEPAKPATPWLEVATLVALVIPSPCPRSAWSCYGPRGCGPPARGASAPCSPSASGRWPWLPSQARSSGYGRCWSWA